MARKKSKHTYGHCAQDSCDREAEHKESGLCKRCYAFQHYWKGRTVTERMKRIKTIEYWNVRAHSMLMPSKVTSIRKKPAQKRRTG